MTFTQEQLVNQAREEVDFWRERDELIPSQQTAIRLRLAEITLAALTAEPVGVARLDMDWTTHRNVFTVDMRPDLVLSELNTGMDLYTAPPAPVSAPDEQHSDRFDWTLLQWAEYVGGHNQGGDPANYYEFGSFMAVAAMLRQFGTVQQKLGWNACRAAMLAEVLQQEAKS